MTIRNDNSTLINLQTVDSIQDRKLLREFLLKQFIQENCQVKFRYFVENLSNGTRIYIERPGRLNKGCDFVIYVEDLILHKNMNDKPPKHNDLFNDLQIKKDNLSPTQYNLLLNAITSIYNLNTYVNSFSIITNLPLVRGWSYELILKLTRWFFIEQDITYWAISGRTMLYNKIMATK